MDALFTFLFKYRPAAFARGDVAFEPVGPWWLVLAAGLAAAGFAAWAYARAGRLPLRDRAVLAALRAASLGLLVTCLAGPVLLVATAVPRKNVVAVLVDDSRSMGIADAHDTTRLAAALADFAPETGGLTRELAGRFLVRVFHFSEALAPLSGHDSAAATGRQTDLAAALSGVRDRLAGEPLAGVIVASDGGDNAGGALTETLLGYRAAGIPVHAVGYGEERFDKDLAVELESTPEHALKGATLVAEVRIRQRGLSGSVPVIVEDEGAVVGQTTIRLPPDGEALMVPVGFTLTEPGARRLRVRVPVQRGEQVAENNVREALVAVENRRPKLLYFEGEPRFEVKFLRQALDGDQQLRVTTLLRTAEDKFLRLDVEDSSEVVAGFPRTRTELFQYRGLVLGSIEASFFTRDQLRMIADFVEQRGGGLLVLGGRGAFTTGGYANTPVADALPVVFPRTADTSFLKNVRVTPTAAGRRHPALRLAAKDEAAAAAKWDSLPPLTMVHPITEVKPGAQTLLTGSNEGTDYVALAAQRYGRGRAAALNVQDTWLWQMDASIPVEDQTHETLWRQLLRWLVADVPDQVEVRPVARLVLPGRPMTLTAEVGDSAWSALNGADVTATVKAPDGTEQAVPLGWVVEHDGEYRGDFTPAADGLYEITVDARRNGRLVGSAKAWARAGDPRREFDGAERRTTLLKRLADETGGRYYDAGATRGLPEDVRYTSAGATTRERLDLWDMPVMLLALLLMLGAEWSYRRVRGLA